jgi:hypothetical protein
MIRLRVDETRSTAARFQGGENVMSAQPSIEPGMLRLAPMFNDDPPVSPPIAGEPGGLEASASTLRTAPAPAPVSVAPPASPPLETLLLRFGLVTPEQLAEAMRDEADSGKTIAIQVVERGWVKEEDLARLVTPSEDSPQREPASAPQPAAPAPAQAPAVETPPAPRPTPAPDPGPPAATTAPAEELPALRATSEPAPEAAVAPEPEGPADESPATPPEPVVEGLPLRFEVVAELINGGRLTFATCESADEARAAAKRAMERLRDASNEWPFLEGRYVRPEAVASITVTAILA